MKRFLLVLTLFTLLCAPAEAASTERVKFQNVTFGESIAQFKSKLPTFTVKQEDDTHVTLSGKIGNKDANIYAFFTPKSKKLYMVVVGFPQKPLTFNSLLESFDEVSTVYENRFGAPDREVRRFSSPYEAGDGYELDALRLGKLFFGNVWNLADGYISCAMAGSESGEFEIIVYYNHNEYGELKEQEDVSALEADL